MMKNTLTATLVVLAAILFSGATYAYSENTVATLDNKKVTVTTLKNYVENIAGHTYKPWLKNSAGLRKLADFYINRTLLLEYAKQSVDKKNTIITNHKARSLDADVMLLTSLLQSEVQDKAIVSEEEVLFSMEKDHITSAKKARQKLESDRKSKLMAALIEKVRSGHQIQYFN